MLGRTTGRNAGLNRTNRIRVRNSRSDALPGSDAVGEVERRRSARNLKSSKV
jgi:hypothetical protein